MKAINLYIIDMTDSGNTSGVDRYVSTLLKGLEAYPFIRTHWIHLRHDPSILFHSEEQTEFYIKITIPLPQQLSEIINEVFWIKKYNEQVYRLVKHLFEGKQNCVLHLHTLNLIDLAVYIRGQIECKIITHLHCIPWKGLYNTNIAQFNKLYAQFYSNGSSEIESRNFVRGHELRSYTASNHIICVTRCASAFLRKTIKEPLPEISIIPNGMNDLFCKDGRHEKAGSDTFDLLYVGVLSQSKGLNFILKAIRKVKQRGYKVTLTVAGKSTSRVSKNIKEENKDLHLNLLGRISFDELAGYYKKCDAGIIASLQEQSSYVAIEMAMFGLPVITTAVDGLDEMFADNASALKVGTLFSRTTGLTVDTDGMADKIIMLIENKTLRRELSKNIRKRYEEEMTLERMMQQTVVTYQNMTGGKCNE